MWQAVSSCASIAALSAEGRKAGSPRLWACDPDIRADGPTLRLVTDSQAHHTMNDIRQLLNTIPQAHKCLMVNQMTHHSLSDLDSS